MNEIAVEVVLIYWLSLPCNHVAVIKIILICTPFQILGPIVGLDFVFVINNKPILIAWHKVESHETMNFIMGIVSVPIAE